MIQRLTLLLSFVLIAVLDTSAAGGKIRAYFNTPVDTTFARNGNKATYLNYAMDDTLIAYINRATATMDIAIYEFSQGSGMSDLAGAINAAYTRGVVVRLIYDGKDNASNSIGLLNAGIPRVASPSGSSYNIMHDKFVVFDAGDAARATVWSGSPNWKESMFDRSVNNALIIEDQPLAQAYKTQFEVMWGSTTTTPNATVAKFGSFKSASTAHSFTIDGKQVELYFSPSDNTNDHINTAVQSADRQAYFGVYTFTQGTIANTLAAKYQTSGITVKGIMDDFSIGYTAYSTLSPVMNNDLKVYNGSNTVYHSKAVVVDPDYPSMDPLVLTGSHNWSVTADTKNDENTLIIHDSTLANEYLQAFAGSFKALGGNMAPSTAIDELADGTAINVYPNPAQDRIYIDVTGAMAEVTATLTDLSGHELSATALTLEHNTISLSGLSSGMYVVKVSTVAGGKVYRVVKV